MKKKIIITLGVLLILFIILPVAAVKVITTFILTPEYLTEKITETINKETNLIFRCKNVELEYFSTWPDISLSVNNGEVIFPALNPDSLGRDPLQIKFNKIYGSLNAMELIRDKKLCLENLKMEYPNINCSQGMKVGKIMKSKGPAKFDIKTNINEIKVTNGYFIVMDNSMNPSFSLKNINIDIKGNLADKEPEFTIDLNCDSLETKIEGFPNTNLNINLKSQCSANNGFQTLDFNDAHLMINSFPLDFNGKISDISNKNIPYIDITFNLPSSNIKEILGYVPDRIAEYYKDYKIDGSTSLNGYVRGRLAKKQLPDIHINGTIENSSIFKKGIKQGIDKLDVELLVSYINSNPDSCFVNIKNASISGFGSSVSLSGQITNLQEKPFAYTDIKSTINANNISKDFIPGNISTLKGYINSDMSLAFNVNDLLEKKWNRIWLTGSLLAKEFEFTSKEYNIEAYSSNTNIDFGYKKNKSDFISGDEVMNGLIDIDSIRIIYKDDISVRLSNLHARSNTTMPKHDEINPPVTVHLDCNQLEAKLDKNKWMSASRVSLHAGTKVSKANKSRNEGALVIDAATLKYIDNSQENAIILNKCNFIAEARPSSAGTAQPFKILKDWDVKGILNFESSSFFIHYFPQIATVSNTQLSFKNNQLSVNRAQIKTGESDFMLSGIISSTKGNTDKNKYEGTLQILANSINYNELKQVLNKGNIMKDNSGAGIFTLDNMEEEMKKTHSGDNKIKPFYIPENIALNIQTNVDNFNYNEVEMLRLAGDIIIKNSKAKINLNTRTNLGKVQLEMLYDSKKTNDIKTYFDLKLNDILIGQIYQVIPEIAKAFPILKSFDGIASCHLTGETSLDNKTIEPDLKTAKAVCSLSGNNLKLMDNRTFEEIAKKFRFKDKKHNNINHIAACMILNKGEINVLPFMISWDRYDAILGGKQNLDFEYDYHIDIVKSPIPIDFGVNIIGKGNKLEYKIKKCKYKNLLPQNDESNEKTDYLRKQITKNIYKEL